MGHQREPGADRPAASLAGPGYPDGIPIVPEDELTTLVARHGVDDVVLAYSDLAYPDVMHKASIALAAGAGFRLLGPHETMIKSTKPVVAVCAVRTGCGKSQTTRRVGRILLDAGFKVALVRHPMPYGDLEKMRVQRFATLADIDASHPSVEEREEYEEPVRMGMIMYAGVDYEQILRQAEAEADVIVWDGGNNDFPFYVPDLLFTIVDPLRPGYELAYYPGEATLRMADAVVVNKIDSAAPADVDRVVEHVAFANPGAALGEGGLTGHPARRTASLRSPGARDRGRPDHHPRRNAVRRRNRRRPAGRRSRSSRPTPLRRRLDRRRRSPLSRHRPRSAGNGLRGRAARRSRRDGHDGPTVTSS